jgi:DNA adenine methylase
VSTKQKGGAKPFKRVPQPLKWHLDGGKYYLAPQIVKLMPRHLHYVEPYGGGLAVLLARNPDDPDLWALPFQGVSEVVCDISGHLMNFWFVLRDPDAFPKLLRLAQGTPFSEELFRQSLVRFDAAKDRVERAYWFFVRCRFSLAGRMDQFTSVTRSRLRGGMNAEVNAWLSCIDGLPQVHARLQRVLVLDAQPAVDLIRRHDSGVTLYYIDPPYLGTTRTNDDVFRNEMSVEQHAELLDVLCRVQGRVMLSGYPSDLYDRKLGGWNRHAFDLPNNAAHGDSKRRMQEVLWTNF